MIFDFSRPMFLLATETPRVQSPNAAKCGRFNQTVGRSAVGSISDYSCVANERGDCARQRIPGLLSGLNKANSESRSTGGSQSSSKDRIATRRARRKVGRRTDAAKAERTSVVDERGVGQSGNEMSSLC